MEAKHVILKEDQILSQNQSISVNNQPAKVSKRYVEDLEAEVRRLKIKNQEYQNYINEMGKDLVREHRHTPILWVNS